MQANKFSKFKLTKLHTDIMTLYDFTVLYEAEQIKLLRFIPVNTQTINGQVFRELQKKHMNISLYWINL